MQCAAMCRVAAMLFCDRRPFFSPFLGRGITQLPEEWWCMHSGAWYHHLPERITRAERGLAESGVQRYSQKLWHFNWGGDCLWLVLILENIFRQPAQKTSTYQTTWPTPMVSFQTSYFKNRSLELTLSDYPGGNPEYVQTTPAGHILLGL